MGKRMLWVSIILLTGLFSLGGKAWSKAEGEGSGKPFGADYVGSAKCAACHKQIYDTFMKSGHPWKITKVVEGKAPELPFTQVPSPPEGYTWSDVSYLIGGYAWKARFMDKKGYIITGADEKARTQWNLANPVVGKEAGWVAYNPGKKEMKYDCGPCYTTGYRPTGHQDNLPGIVGTWAEAGIQCEA